MIFNKTIKKLLNEIYAPEDAVVCEVVFNCNDITKNNYQIKKSYLTFDGNLIIDGVFCKYNEILYVNKNKNLVRKLTKQDKEFIYNTNKTHIDYIIGLSEKIDRDAKKLTKQEEDELSNKSNREPSFFDDNAASSWKDIRYPYNGNYGLLRTFEWIDNISDEHNPNLLKNAMIWEIIKENYAFRIIGYLHIKTNVKIDNDVVKAFNEFKQNGGRLGKTVIDALNSLDDWN